MSDSFQSTEDPTRRKSKEFELKEYVAKLELVLLAKNQLQATRLAHAKIRKLMKSVGVKIIVLMDVGPNTK